MTSKDPNFRTFAHDGISKEKAKFTFFRVVVVQKLWKQQVWCDGNASLLYCKAAVGSGSTTKWR